MWPKDNPESWQRIKEEIADYPDDGWSRWKQMVMTVISALEASGLSQYFRIGIGMHHIILSTAERHGLGSEPRVTVEFNEKEQIVRVAYGCANISFHEPSVQERVAPSVAVPCILRYLRRLWIETKPDNQIPDALKVA
jgi:hypothetical protein